VRLVEVGRVPTGHAPDGVAWDPTDQRVGVSDQRDGALSIVAGSGMGPRTQVALGVETGNVAYDAGRHRFWITVERSSPPDQLVGVDPVATTVIERIDLPGCRGAHGLRLHPDGRSALVACEENATVGRLDLTTHAFVTARSASDPDVLSIDPSLGWLYVASESGSLRVFDIARPGLVEIDNEHPGDDAHSVSVDPATHRVFFPLVRGASGTPVLRILRPTPG
jgi:DNA-binding beta-propeller fold protein YncE